MSIFLTSVVPESVERQAGRGDSEVNGGRGSVDARGGGNMK